MKKGAYLIGWVLIPKPKEIRNIDNIGTSINPLSKFRLK
jgi:hypothetical protein